MYLRWKYGTPCVFASNSYMHVKGDSLYTQVQGNLNFSYSKQKASRTDTIKSTPSSNTNAGMVNSVFFWPETGHKKQ